MPVARRGSSLPNGVLLMLPQLQVLELRELIASRGSQTAQKKDRARLSISSFSVRLLGVTEEAR
jgi:hypothetical protein